MPEIKIPTTAKRRTISIIVKADFSDQWSVTSDHDPFLVFGDSLIVSPPKGSKYINPYRAQGPIHKLLCVRLTDLLYCSLKKTKTPAQESTGVFDYERLLFLCQSVDTVYNIWSLVISVC